MINKFDGLKIEFYQQKEAAFWTTSFRFLKTPIVHFY